jgi:hypothetical protein
MEEREYQIWWQLHRRVATGKILSDHERRIYEAGRMAMETDDMSLLHPFTPDWEVWQDRWRELNQRNQQLAEQESALRRLATELEQQYLKLTGEKIGLEV